MACPVMVKEPAAQYTSNLLKACEDNFSRVYPDCVNSSDHGTIMCPAAFQFGYVAPVGEASGGTLLSDIETASFNGDTAELNIFHALEKFGRETKQPMFVLTQLKFKELTKEVLQQILPADHPTLTQLQDLEGEIDFLIVHRQIGVILIEVKATAEFKKQQHNAAKKQLKSGEKVIKDLLHGIADNEETSIPVYKVTAMPNVVDRQDRARAHGEFINLRQGHLGSEEDFQCWWREHFAEKEFASHQQQELQKLISILVGQRSTVSSPAKVLSDVVKKIDKQSFLQRSFDKCARQEVDGPEKVVKTADKPDLAILARQFMFLNPEQQRIWNGPLHQFFCGAAGSGKTILLQHKALECAKKGEKVVVMVPPPLTTRYENFFNANETSVFSEINVVSDVKFMRFVEPYSDNSKTFHFFADDWQGLWGDALYETPLVKFLMNFPQDYYCWVAYDDMQYCETLGRSGLMISSIQIPIEDICKNSTFYHANSLTTVVRSTIQVYSYWSSACPSRIDISLERIQQVPDFAKDMATFPLDKYWLYLVHLGHQICGPSVTELTISKENITQVIKKEILDWARDGGVYSYQKVAVLVTPYLKKNNLFSKEELLGYMQSERIPFCNLGDDENAVVLDYGNQVYSYEWPVVIAICSKVNDLSNYLMFSRAITRLVVLYFEGGI